ncbi:MAG: C4-dicarboxylate TRAP transporter substrate-binding protein [Gammaproteobacteria bacterium]
MRDVVWKIATLLLAVAGLSGCSDSKSITLRIGAGHPAGPAVYVTQMRDYFVPEVKQRVAARTRYKVNFVEGYGGSIAKVAETLEAVQNGILDIGGYCVCFEPAKLFLHNFAYFVPFGPQDSEQAIRIARQVYDENPWLGKQLSENYNQQLLALNGWDNYHLGTIKPWDKVEDLRGIKIGGAGPNLPWLEYAGAIPVQSSLPDGYLSLQTGVYAGWLMFPSAYYSFKFYEPAPYYTLIGFGVMGGAVVLTMNDRSMKRLPAEVRQIILEVAHDYEQEAARALGEAQVKGLDDLKKAGAIIRQLPEDVRSQWARSLVNFPQKMARDADGRNMPGSEVIRSYIELVKQSGYKWPVEYVIK